MQTSRGMRGGPLLARQPTVTDAQHQTQAAVTRARGVAGMRKGMARDMARLALSKLIQAMDYSDNTHHSDTLCTYMSPSCDLSRH
jgi:hypothetical protein